MDLNVAHEAQKTHRRTVSDIPIFDDDDNVRFLAYDVDVCLPVYMKRTYQIFFLGGGI